MSEKLHITMINSGIFTSVMLLFSRNIVIADTERMHCSNYAQLQKTMAFLCFMMISQPIIHLINCF